MSKNFVTILVHANFPKSRGDLSPGDTIRLPANRHGQPTSTFWRRRLKDAEIDGCCEIAVPERKPKSKKSKAQKKTPEAEAPAVSTTEIEEND